MKNAAKEYAELVLKMFEKTKQQISIDYYRWILKEGKSFEFYKELPEDQRGKMKQCYYNAQLYVLDNPTILYYEGWATTKAIGIPFEHGFNIQYNKVIDKTWADGSQYFGVHIPTDYVSKRLVETGEANNILFWYFNDTILKNERGQNAKREKYKVGNTN